MWLVRCSDFALVRFDGMMSRDAEDRPRYLILSHTWGAEEVTFSDMANIEAAKRKKGWVKIEGICQVARGRNVDYAWVDTCCIDKSSSAELTESINSMYAYYREALVCIAYLEDLELGEGLPTEEQLRRCRWFTRGWTLQELIAPENVLFYDTEWELRCDRLEVLEAIQGITDIDRRVLGRERRPLDNISIAQKMSWAAGRTTTRIEDRAYSLLGIFGVNMPLIYGEGQGAFRRLQEAILQQTNDLSIFAWKDPAPSDDGLCGFLAPRPEAFSRAGTIELMDDPNIPIPSFTVTNAAVEMATSLGIHYDEKNFYTHLYGAARSRMMMPEGGDHLLHLHCTMYMRQDTDSSHGRNDIHVVFLLLVRTRHGLVRTSGTGLCVLRQSEVRFLEPVEVVLPKSVPKSILRLSTEINQYTDWGRWEVLDIDLSGGKKSLSHVIFWDGSSTRATHYPEHLFDPGIDCFRIDNNPHFVGVVRIECLTRTCDEVGKHKEPPENKGDYFWLVCGKSRREDGETEIWATLYTKDMVESGLLVDVGVYCEGDFRNPMAISNIGNRLRNLRSGSGWGESVATKQTINMVLGDEVVEVSWSSSREAERCEIGNQPVWKHSIQVHIHRYRMDGSSRDFFEAGYTVGSAVSPPAQQPQGSDRNKPSQAKPGIPAWSSLIRSSKRPIRVKRSM